MSLMTIPWTLSKRLWARARGEPSYFIVFSKNARCSSVRGCTYLTIGTSSWGVQSKAKVYIVLDMGRYYTKKLLGGRLAQLHVFVRPVVALVVFEHLMVAEVQRLLTFVGRHDVPGNAAATEVIQSGHQAREQERRIEGRR